MAMELGAIVPNRRDAGLQGGKEVSEQDALRSFDAYFLGEMLKRATAQGSEESATFDGGAAGRMYRDYLNEELARIVAASGEFGMAQTLEGGLGGGSAPGAQEKTRGEGA